MGCFNSSAMLKHRLILVFLVLACFSCTLWNGFSADDNFLFVNNSFYYNPSNIIRVFQPGYNIVPDNVLYGSAQDKGTGSVAYRPVTTMSFFVDSLVWKNRPWGYHLTSMLLHLFNVLLLYEIVIMMATPQIALIAAVIFSIHPANTEPVIAIGYRSDLLVGSFLLIALWAWLIFRQKGLLSWAVIACAAYFLALFSKETALLFPLAVLFFDRVNFKKTCQPKGAWEYALFLGAALFYLYIYWHVFPNTAFNTLGAMGQGWQDYVSIFIQIMALYLKEIFFVLSAGIMPPLYWPLPRPIISLPIILQGLIVIGTTGFLLFYICRRYKYSWAAVWCVIFFLPVMAFWVNPNPVALRYMYVPFAGIAFLVAVGLVQIWDRWEARVSAGLRFFICIAAILALALPAIASNLSWRNNFSLGEAWVKGYPEHYKGYFFKATEFLRLGKVKEAADNFKLALKDSRCDQLLSNYYFGISCLILGRLDEARNAFEEILRQEPASYRGHAGLGDYYYLSKQYPKAVLYLEKVLPVNYNDETALKLLVSLHHAEGPAGVARGLEVIGKILGKGPRLKKIDEFARTLSAASGSVNP
ncbi:MAG: tetratricopeptide repeat protein [Candidatus Omnitrophota bacterium]